MPYPFFRLLSAIAAVFLLAGCDSVSTEEASSRYFDAIRREFGPQALGSATVYEVGDITSYPAYRTMARHNTTGLEYNEPSFRRFYVSLNTSDGLQGVALSTAGVIGSELQPGQVLGVGIFGSRDTIGDGQMKILSVDGTAISGVFVGELRPRGFFPDFRRVRGAFNAVLDTTGR